MDSVIAVRRLQALAQDSRLAAFRILVKAGAQGVSAGELARALEVPANTLSAHLTVLANTGLVSSRREGRSIIYAAGYDAMSELLAFLLEDCCQGRPEVCAPLAAAVVQSAACCTPQSQATS